MVGDRTIVSDFRINLIQVTLGLPASICIHSYHSVDQFPLRGPGPCETEFKTAMETIVASDIRGS